MEQLLLIITHSLILFTNIIICEKVQSTLGFTTMGLVANLGIATATPLTDLCHYILVTLDIMTTNFGPFVAK